jgi:hypothetical protein
MLRLLLQRHRIKVGRKITERKLVALLNALLPYYMPAFRDVDVDADKVARGRGRPRSGITDRQKATIDRAVADRKSVRRACLRLAKGDTQAASALAAAYRRATKMR